MRLYPDSPIIEIRVNRASVDTIHVSANSALAGWKLDGFLGNELAAPDQIQDEFDAVVSMLAEYIDEMSVWTNTETGQQISPWQAMVLLTHHNGQD